MRAMWRRCGLGLAGLAACLSTPAVAFAQTSYSGAVYLVSIDTADGERSDAVYLLNGIDLERGIVRASATLPLMLQRSSWAIPGVENVDAPWLSGFADPIFRVDIEAWRAGSREASLGLSASVKVPLASVEDGFSSGETDYSLGLSWSAFRGRQSVLVDVTYWMFGDPPDVDYRNAASFYIGYGRVLDRRYRWSAIVSANGSPSVIPGADPSVQISAAVLRAFGAGSALGVSADFGLTDSAADFAVGAMWRVVF